MGEGGIFNNRLLFSKILLGGQGFDRGGQSRNKGYPPTWENPRGVDHNAS